MQNTVAIEANAHITCAHVCVCVCEWIMNRLCEVMLKHSPKILFLNS